MNLKLKRLVRTPHSEQYALFDLDQPDADGAPRTIGKLDLHYTAEGMYGTLLLWDASMRTLRPRTRRSFVHALLREIAQPMGVPNEYVVEFFAPALDQYEVFHNVEVEPEEERTPLAAEETLDFDEGAGFDARPADEADDEDLSDEEALDSDLNAGGRPFDESPPPPLSEPPPVRRFAPRTSDAA